MDLYEAMENRRSIRDFTDAAIPKDVMERILKAAYQAPANDHFRDWHFVVVTDREILAKMLAGVPQDLSERDVDAMEWISDPVQKESYRIAVPKQYRMLFDAAAVVVPLMKKKVRSEEHTFLGCDHCHLL